MSKGRDCPKKLMSKSPERQRLSGGVGYNLFFVSYSLSHALRAWKCSRWTADVHPIDLQAESRDKLVNCNRNTPTAAYRMTAWRAYQNPACRYDQSSPRISRSGTPIVWFSKHLWEKRVVTTLFWLLQGCNISPCLFNILAGQVMQKALQGFSGGFRISEEPSVTSGGMQTTSSYWQHHRNS